MLLHRLSIPNIEKNLFGSSDVQERFDKFCLSKRESKACYCVALISVLSVNLMSAYRL
jgi:hypothetical protein